MSRVGLYGSSLRATALIEAPVWSLSGFSEDARSRGEDPGVIWMIKSYVTPTDEEATALSISNSTKVVRLRRVRLSGREPFAIEHAVVLAEFLPDFNLLGDSLYAALTSRGARPVSGTQRIRAALATPTEAAFLSIEEKAEILRIERLTRMADGRVIEFTCSASRGDQYEFVSNIAVDPV